MLIVVFNLECCCVQTRALLCSIIKCSLLLGGGVTQCVSVIRVGDERNGARGSLCRASHHLVAELRGI